MTTTLAKLPVSKNPRVVIVGGGFAGTELAKKLSKAPLQVVLIDKNNYYTFQPLLYQVATAGLNAPSIVYPYRKILEKGEDTFFRLAEVESVDPVKRIIETSIGLVHYDYLVIATGATTNYYGNEQIERHAIAMKSVEDALMLRNTILCNFEKALQIGDEEQLNSLMDFVIVGGGPTGVEIAGALSELRKHVFPKDYKELDFIKMDIHLIQSGDHILKGMSKEASTEALHFLKAAGVQVWLNRRVKSFDGYTVTLDNGEKLCSRTLIWAAGVTGAPIKGLSEECITSGNRLKVDEYNRLTGYENIFAIGDIAEMATAEKPEGYPMLAQPALQQGRLLGDNLPKLIAGKPLKPFVYADKGALATIGRKKAVADVKIFNKEIRTQGVFAWFIWLFVHLFSIIGFKNRLMVFVNWIWNYLSYDAVMRVIIGAKKENIPVEKSTDKVLV
ncbi:MULTISPECIES: NAD(P)/FAD-dependent oxidoreductase [Niastella]|uniref:NADH:ubiquinone reductase (non-electrogenic) n=1 Tax=Niastella soli TaxID=2821487 RepID=A0ABS3YT65_9BACT|nr:NAD(P)/FAD-dependent oxidoreductase [Niastella soli]MBO9200983.1 NAD(P)/FAD-dependent oxidoreductase [Niastella soli]